MFTLKSDFKPTGDQPQAIKSLLRGVNAGLKDQTLLGVTGSGKTFTMANVIQKSNLPTLIISHNKTLAGQLYQEMRDFFPEDAVSYFVSYYDYYQPEAYIPSSDTYIEKEAQINDTIDKLRLQATTNILTRKNVITVASVSCIYNIGSPVEYGNYILPAKVGDDFNLSEVLKKLVHLQYERSEYEFKRGSFRVRGNRLDIYPAYQDSAYRLTIENEKLENILEFDPLTGKPNQSIKLNALVVYPAKHYLLNPDAFKNTESQIRKDLKEEVEYLKKKNKLIEAQRLAQRTNYDLEIIKEIGYVNGIENYSRYFDGRLPGERPFTLLDYYNHEYGKDWLCIVDESHMTIPQLRGMYNGDHSRKLTLIENGFRLKAALDNRPLKFEEFYEIPPRCIYVSATPDKWEIEKSNEDAKAKKLKDHNGIVEQLIRPTGIIDPEIEIRSSDTEIENVIEEIVKRAKKNERTLVTTLTKKTAEDLSEYLKERGIRANYLHSDVKTLERSDILDKLRKNEFDALIGVNLLREGLDLPEVTLVAILDADKEGFLRSRVSLIQTMGRAARNVKGKVILYANTSTGSMRIAIKEILRRRKVQQKYNQTNNITPKTISKPIRDKIADIEISPDSKSTTSLVDIKTDALTPHDIKKLIKKLEGEMRKLANDLRFEDAIAVREKIKELKGLKI